MAGRRQPGRLFEPHRRACSPRRAAACLAVLLAPLAVPQPAAAQTLTPDMLRAVPGGFASPEQSPLRPVADATLPPLPDGASPDRNRERPAPSRIGKPPTYDVPAASGAAVTGFDSLNRKRLKPKPYPGAPKPKVIGPGTSPVLPNASPPGPAARASRVPVAAAVAGTVAGQPPRRPLKPEDDPFGNVGFYAGGFLTKAAVELRGGYDTNPGRLNTPRGSAFYQVAPELLMTSDWERHSLIVDLRGSFTGYGTRLSPGVSNDSPPVPVALPVPTDLDRPDFTGRIAGRVDVTRDTRINSELRLRIFTDNPGSPNIQAGLSRYPLATSAGATLGGEHDFNRLQVSVAGLVDRTTYQWSHLTDGTVSPNDDRNFNQYGGLARVSYDLMPGLKPFVEGSADTRVHDLAADRAGYLRDSTGGYVKGGTTFEFSRLLTGEAALGYTTRHYNDARLSDLRGLLTSASLVWTATGLTMVTLAATSSIDETTLPGVSGVVSRDYSLQIDHAFRRWLIGTAKAGFGTSDYGGTRFDRRSFVEGNLVYKLSRTFHIKAQVRHDWLLSSIVGASSEATVVTLGVRVQR